jgi:hypothetical protein
LAQNYFLRVVDCVNSIGAMNAALVWVRCSAERIDRPVTRMSDAVKIALGTSQAIAVKK